MFLVIWQPGGPHTPLRSSLGCPRLCWWWWRVRFRYRHTFVSVTRIILTVRCTYSPHETISPRYDHTLSFCTTSTTVEPEWQSDSPRRRLSLFPRERAQKSIEPHGRASPIDRNVCRRLCLVHATGVFVFFVVFGFSVQCALVDETLYTAVLGDGCGRGDWG